MSALQVKSRRRLVGLSGQVPMVGTEPKRMIFLQAEVIGKPLYERERARWSGVPGKRGNHMNGVPQLSSEGRALLSRSMYV
jgi:hypothetical protein